MCPSPVLWLGFKLLIDGINFENKAFTTVYELELTEQYVFLAELTEQCVFLAEVWFNSCNFFRHGYSMHI